MGFFIFDILAQTTSLDSHHGWMCNLAARTSMFVPQSPITLGGLALQIGDSLPFVGGKLVFMVLTDLYRVLSVVILWKIFKALPGKFS